MRYYKYVRMQDQVFVFRVHKAVQACKAMAILKYRSRWEDALDDAYFHIIKNFDDSKGSLEHYAMSIVSTIYLNKYSKEVGSETVLEIESERKAMESVRVSNPYDDLLDALEEEGTDYDEEVHQCIKYLLPLFIKDYEMFRSKDSSDRKMKYSGLFDMFSFKVISSAVKILADDYYDDAKYINTLSKNCHVKNFKEDRYKSSLDKTLSYISRIDDIVRCKAIGVKRKKYAYLIDIVDVLSKIFSMFYDKEGVAQREIDGVPIYCSLSGQILLSKDELFETLEREIVGTLLALRTNLKVLNYERGKELVVTSTRVYEPEVIIQMFQAGVHIPMKKLMIGRVIR